MTALSTAPTVSSLARALQGAGVPMLVLRRPTAGRPGAHGFGDGAIELLIPRQQRAVALRHFDGMDWRYHLGTSGAWRLLPAANYWWPAMNVFVYWGLPALPLPAAMLRRLERHLWEGASPAPEGSLEPEPAALLVHLAFQASRPGAGDRTDDWRHFLHCLEHVEDWPRVWEIAAAANVLPGVRAAVDAAEDGAERPPPPGAVMTGPAAVGWRLASAVQRRARPGSLRALLGGQLRLGDAPVRCRMKGIEVLTGPGVFVPTPDADIFVDLALDRIHTAAHPTVVEIGTGSGGIALAVASAHPGATVHATDTSRAAVRWAERNRRRLGLDQVSFHRGSLLHPMPPDIRGTVSIIVANLPFYPSQQFAPIGAVPKDTIVGGQEDGLGLLRDLARDARAFLAPDGCLVLQMFAWQWERLGPELTALGYRPGVPRRSGPFAICPAELDPGSGHRG